MGYTVEICCSIATGIVITTIFLKYGLLVAELDSAAWPAERPGDFLNAYLGIYALALIIFPGYNCKLPRIISAVEAVPRAAPGFVSQNLAGLLI